MVEARDEPPLEAPTRVGGASTKRLIAGLATTRTHFEGLVDRTTLDQVFEYYLRKWGSDT